MHKLKRLTGMFTAFVFAAVSLLSNQVFALDSSIASLPVAGNLVTKSDMYTAPLMKGLVFDPKNPLNFKFIFDTVDDDKVSKASAERMIRYFLAGLTLNEESLWVNLSPYESERVMEDKVASTEVGREMLAQDYLLKQLSASLTYPETDLGQKFWQNDANADSLSKIWIKPENALIYEHKNIAMIKDATLTVESEVRGSNSLLPTIKEEVNNGANFSQLRQLYHSMILAQWFKAKFRNSFYKNYFNKEKVNNLDLVDESYKQEVYNKYVEAFNKGVYDYVRKETNQAGYKQKKHYFCGGINQNTKESSAVVVVDEQTIENLMSSNVQAVDVKVIERNPNDRTANYSNIIPYDRNLYYPDAKLLQPSNTGNIYYQGDKYAIQPFVVAKDKSLRNIDPEGMYRLSKMMGTKLLQFDDKFAMNMAIGHVAVRRMAEADFEFFFNNATGASPEDLRRVVGNPALHFGYNVDAGKINNITTLDNWFYFGQWVLKCFERGMSEEEILLRIEYTAYGPEQIHFLNPLFGGNINDDLFIYPRELTHLTKTEEGRLFMKRLASELIGTYLFSYTGVGIIGHVGFSEAFARMYARLGVKFGITEEGYVTEAKLADGTDLTKYGLVHIPNSIWQTARKTNPKVGAFRQDGGVNIEFGTIAQNLGYHSDKQLPGFIKNIVAEGVLVDFDQLLFEGILTKTEEELKSFGVNNLYELCNALNDLFDNFEYIPTDAITMGPGPNLKRMWKYLPPSGLAPIHFNMADDGKRFIQPLAMRYGPNYALAPQATITLHHNLAPGFNAAVTEGGMANLDPALKDLFWKVDAREIANPQMREKVDREYKATKEAQRREWVGNRIKELSQASSNSNTHGGVVMNATKVMDIEASDDVVDIEVTNEFFNNLSFEIISTSQPSNIKNLI